MQRNKLDRREFLTATASAAAAVGFPYIVPSSALGKAGTIAPSNRIVMGAIGVGHMGNRDMMKGFLRRDNVQIVAVCDVDKKFRDRAKRNCDAKYQSRDHKGNFLDCIATRAETVAPAEIAHRSISVALLGEIAMLTGRKLKWNPVTEKFINDDEANGMLSRPMRSPWQI